ncbi:uncharacterized protein LOC124453112 [Xenia sp. Carnegie-2017]|uniref:uncharacterized protein LOC124453112 n=1 Tax=Xenia sp. Carnegie-2017 TaxID=2897299 RepID=UPI001F035F27|nr:uncharacterized protein LOC124453112 [Xenia sp. Carnegie-2017]
MSLILKMFFVNLCIYIVSGKPSRHNVEKRWAYIENGDPQMRSIHTDCKKIVKEYSDGEMPFYEYKAKMKKCTERQSRTNIPSYDDLDEFTPSFNIPHPPSKRYEVPENSHQQLPYAYPNYAYYSNQYGGQNSGYGTIYQRANIGFPQYQAQPYQPNYNYYPQQQTSRRSLIPFFPQEQEMSTSMYDTSIVKKNDIPQPDSI